MRGKPGRSLRAIVSCLVASIGASLLVGASPLRYLSSEDPAVRYANAVAFLSASDMDGRGIGTPGLVKAEAYVASSFAALGVAPFAPAGPGLQSRLIPDYFHAVQVLTGVEAISLSLSTTSGELVSGTDFAPASMSGSGSFEGDLVDVGFGTNIPEMNHDDYANRDVAGKIVLAQRFLPDNSMSVEKQKQYSDLAYKASLARERGAAALLLWSDDESTGSAFPALTKQYRTSALPILHVSRPLAREWRQGQTALHLAGRVELRKTFSTSRNVVGRLGGACEEGHKAVVVGAHLDHLGWGDSGSLEPSQKGLHPGADDNASGVAGVLEVAQLIQTVMSPETLIGRCFVFVAFAAEEQGIVGSNALVSTWRKLGWKAKAMINLDMVGRLREEKVTIFGMESADEWSSLSAAACKGVKLNCPASGDSGLGRSDHVAFLVNGIPAIHLTTGSHEDYHRTTDTCEKINSEGGVRIARVASELALAASTPESPFVFREGATGDSAGDLPTHGAYLGTMPDFAGGDQNVKGVRLAGAVPGSPAEKAGVKPGDILIAVDARETPTLDDLMNVLRTLHPGDVVVLRVYREGQTLALPTTVGSRRR